MQRTVSTTIKIVDEASAELQQIKNEVQQTGTASADMQKKVDGISDTLNEAQSASESFKSQIRELREAMAQMLAEGVQPADEQFQALARRAGALEDAMGDANRVIKDFASDTHNLDKYTSGVKGLASAYGIYVSALNLAGVENEKVEKALKQMVAVQTLLNSVQELSNQLQNQSSGLYKAYHAILRMVGLEKRNLTSATSASTAATVAETTATKGATLATRAASAALKGFKVALASTGIGLLIVGVGELVTKLLDLTGALGDAEDGEKNLGKSVKDTNTSIKDQKSYVDQLRGSIQDLKNASALDAEFEEVVNKNKEKSYQVQLHYLDEMEKKYKSSKEGSEFDIRKHDNNESYYASQSREKAEEEYKTAVAGLKRIEIERKKIEDKQAADEQARRDKEKQEYQAWLDEKTKQDEAWAKDSEDLNRAMLAAEKKRLQDWKKLQEEKSKEWEKQAQEVADSVAQQVEWNKRAREEEAKIPGLIAQRKEKYADAAMSIYSSTKGMTSSVSGLVDTLQGESNAWEKVTAVIDTAVGIYQSVSAVIQAVQAAETAASAVKKTTSAQNIEANSAEATSNVALGASGYMAAHSAIPWVGLAIGLASVAAMIATMASLPKFAKGGIAYGPTLGLFGEYSNASTNPEVVAPLDRLRSLIGDNGGVGGNVTFRIEGRSLVGILNKENTKRSRS